MLEEGRCFPVRWDLVVGRGAALSAATGRNQFSAREVSAVVTVPSLDVASVLNSERKTQAIRIVLWLAFFLKDDQGWGSSYV